MKTAVFALVASAAALAALPRAARAETAHSIAEHPIILIPGLWWEYAPGVYGKEVWSDYVVWLQEIGFAKADIHILNYPSHRDLTTVRNAMAPGLAKILAAYPPETTFYVAAHSLGGFVGLDMILHGDLAPRIARFISLAGVPLGWDGFDICRFGLCGAIHPLIIPYRSSWIQRMLAAHAEGFAQLPKCSLFSHDDELVHPYDAGRNDDGVNVELTGFRHMDMVWKREVFDAMAKACL